MENSKIRLKRETKGSRVDSLQNRDLLIATTVELIKEKGADFSMGELAQRSKMSRMTIYRNFPDKYALVSAVFHYNLENLSNYAHTLKGDKDAFYKLLDIVLKQRIEYNNLEQYIKEEEFTSTTNILYAIFRQPVNDAIAAKTLRADFDVEHDLLYLIAMIGGVAPLLKIPNFEKSDRFLELLLNGVRGE